MTNRSFDAARRATAAHRDALRRTMAAPPTANYRDPAQGSMPDLGVPCQVMASDGRAAPYTIPFPVAWDGTRWHNVRNSETALTVRVVAWRYSR